MSKRIVLILAHPDSDSFCAALAQRYESAALAAGHEVSRLNLGELRFDPILRGGFRGGQALEPDLKAAQAAISAAERLVFVYPYWWGVMPALLKGFIDRVFLPGFAFKYQDGSPFPAKLLAGREAQLIVTSDTPPWYNRLVYGRAGLRLMRAQVLEFCGIRLRKTLEIGPVRGSQPKARESWLRQVGQLASR